MAFGYRIQQVTNLFVKWLDVNYQYRAAQVFDRALEKISDRERSNPADIITPALPTVSVPLACRRSSENCVGKTFLDGGLIREK